MLLTLSGRSFIKIQYSSFPLFPVAYPFRIATQLQYYVKREKFKVNDIIFPSGCEARAINLGNKNMKIGIFTGGTSVRSKNIFTDISRYFTGKHEINHRIKKKKIPIEFFDCPITHSTCVGVNHTSRSLHLKLFKSPCPFGILTSAQSYPFSSSSSEFIYNGWFQCIMVDLVKFQNCAS